MDATRTVIARTMNDYGTLIDQLLYYRSLRARLRFSKRHCEHEARRIIALLNGDPPPKAEMKEASQMPFVPEPKPPKERKAYW